MYPDVVLILSHQFFLIETNISSISLMFHQQQPTMTTHVAADYGRLWKEKIIRGVPCLEDPEKTETFEAVSTSTEVSETRLAEDAETMSGMPEMPKTRSES